MQKASSREWARVLGASLKDKLNAGGWAGGWVRGRGDYSRQEYHEAIALLQDIQVSRQLEMVRKIYLGNALAMTGRYREATTFLEPVSSHALPDPWGSEARWTLFVSWLELGETARADSLARELTEIPRDVGRRARHYLQQTE